MPCAAVSSRSRNSRSRSSSRRAWSASSARRRCGDVQIEPGEPRDAGRRHARSARPRLCIHDTVPSGRTMRKVLSHASCRRRAEDLARGGRAPAGGLPRARRDIQASCVGGSSGVKPYRARKPSSQSMRLVLASHVQEPPPRRRAPDAAAVHAPAAPPRRGRVRPRPRSVRRRRGSSAISIGVHERGVALLAPKAATSCPPFSSITPTNAAICLACMATRSDSVNLGSVCNVVHDHSLAAPERIAQRRRQSAPTGPCPTSGATPRAYSRRMT